MNRKAKVLSNSPFQPTDIIRKVNQKIKKLLRKSLIPRSAAYCSWLTSFKFLIKVYFNKQIAMILL